MGCPRVVRRTVEASIFPDTPSEGVPKMPEARSVSFWHFWHWLTQEYRGVDAHPP
jgi:hypothetical protein